MIASILIIRSSAPALRVPECTLTSFLRLQVIRLFAVLRDIQPFDFLLFRYPQTRNRIYDLQNHNRSYQREYPREPNAHQLVAHLAPMSIQPAGRFSRAINWIVNRPREYSG